MSQDTDSLWNRLYHDILQLIYKEIDTEKSLNIELENIIESLCNEVVNNIEDQEKDSTNEESIEELWSDMDQFNDEE